VVLEQACSKKVACTKALDGWKNLDLKRLGGEKNLLS
jgi:hypothetical protein